ncbi:MAG: hypothetical protein II939_00670 [Bacteroidales bacterium]|nr:hypothetical protein [Bacteroidales bacterium]
MELPASIYENEIRRGRILHSDSFVNIGHGKFFAIIGITEDSIVGFFFVNSNINKYIQDKPEMMAVQYPLRKQDYDFLRYDSFLCATEVEEIKKSDILEGISNGSVIFVDELKKEHLDEVLNMVRKSRLFGKRDKERFFYE